jgi:hypothetical protein
MRNKFPVFIYPKFSKNYVREGATLVKNLFGFLNLPIEFHVQCNTEIKMEKKIEFKFLSSYKKALSMNLSSKLNLLNSELCSLKEKQACNEETFRQLESSLKFVCSVREHDKLLLHVVEVKNLCFLLVVLSCRLVRTEYGLASMDWRGVEERDDLERKREMLEVQMEEGKMLKERIEKRSEVIGEYFDKYFGGEERNKFERYLRCKVRLCIEMREVEEMSRVWEIIAHFVDKMSEHC